MNIIRPLSYPISQFPIITPKPTTKEYVLRESRLAFIPHSFLTTLLRPLSFPELPMSPYRRLFILCTIPLTPLLAQQSQQEGPAPWHEPPPSISASGSSNVKVTPDRATIRVSVQTHASTAAAAASENARKQSAVISKIRSLGFSNDQISTTDYTVEPQYRYEQNKAPVVAGYNVTNTIVVDIHDVKQVGPVIDAALGNGANMISSLDFYASNTSEARRQAITEAVRKARGEAEAAAQGAGGTLGKVLDITVNGDYQQPPRPMFAKSMAPAADMATPINPGQETVTVTVFTRWTFQPSR